MRKSYIALGVFMVLILVGLGFAGKWWNGVSSKVFISPEENYPIKQEAKSPARSFLEDKTPLNILLLGYGGGKHDGTYLTDTMILANIDPVKKRITLISIPRNTWVKSNENYVKINSIYENGINNGGKSVEEAVKSVLGLPVNYFVGVDFDGFSKGIDILGGVDVNVEVAFDDNQYPIEGAENELCGHDESELKEITATASATKEPQLIFPCRYENLHFDAGITHMDGVTALKYVRSRHSTQDGNDFGRSRRQKNLLLAVEQKILAVNFLPKILPFVNTLGNNVKTDLKPEDVVLLIQNAGVVSKYQINSLALTDDNFLTFSFSDDRQYILIPKAGIDNFNEIYAWISEQLNMPVQPTDAVVMIKNGTEIKGLAQNAVQKLKSVKIQTLTPINAEKTDYVTTEIIIFDESVDQKQITLLKEVLGVTKVETATNEAETKYNVLVILGQDYSK
jgi:polyisoprenyl-teichoic acid--peptidoglycan teichoic acid transferase